MLILGIESATTQVGCAIGGHEGVLASAHSARGRRHAESLVPQIDFVRRDARVELSEISVIAVDVGPGLFTGLRVGLASAKALAHALRIPMIGVESLDLVAFAVRYTSRRIVAAIDARRDELFYAFYRQVPGGIQRERGPELGSPDDLAAELVAGNVESLLVGDGAIRHRTTFSGLAKVDIADSGLAHPTATALVQLAHARALREEWVTPSDISPLYLRKPDAEINWSVRNA